MSRVFEVTDICYTTLESNPVQHSISAEGKASTAGWTDPQLSPYIYVRPPEDGIQDFDFIATPPSGFVIQRLTPISASWSGQLPNWVKGVRIHTVSNNKEIVFSKTPPSKSQNFTVAGGEVPWPL